MSELITGVVCPWCKHVPRPIEWVFCEDAKTGGELFAVGCSACDAHGPAIDTKEDAIKAWESWGGE